MTITSKRLSSRGFTFVELLIALAIFSIIAVSVYSVFRAGVRLWKSNNAAFDSNRAARYFFDTAASDMRNAFVYPGMDIVGTPDGFSFMALVTAGAANSSPGVEIARVSYIFDKDAGVVRRMVAGKEEGFDQAYSRISEFQLGEGQFSFSYCYRPKAEGAPYEWRGYWNAKDKMPRGVRIRSGEFDKWIFIPMGESGTGE
jgi:prepilin-type N-terminal cleavage/methylation domain-containing protein